jgi:glycosyltransferase involved in cell wall biosynthesis
MLLSVQITAVVPMHNSRDTIPDALASIAAQTQPPAQVIVVDDASSDDSIEVARASGLPALEVMELKPNRGPGGARNAGASRATTEWLAFLDADDTWAPTFLEEVSAALRATDADFAGTGGIRQMVHREPIVRLIEAPAEAADRTIDFWKIASRFSPIVPSCAVIRKTLFQQVGAFPEDVRSGEDMTLFARLWLEGRFAFVNRPLYQSGQLANGLSAGPRSYRDTAMFTTRLGATLVRAIARRKPGTQHFALAYGRRVTKRHATWLRRIVRPFLAA